ncbi:sigma-70 family RNA polymerase sigma factor [Ureibacillus acetophenoni]|uniref:RNA polymerase sigma-70 factor n=1 Tax=Ureibacillus acetophenoni TaxID=614649 RepID=A0A285U9A9_9BACL|nr:sigma-70 family RNA polymerase sigma factor [Ureibacillus acetophenoni]SOC37126.1 RNA polymerase sigma-70 factor [Ureibacillus acetophenoni]
MTKINRELDFIFDEHAEHLLQLAYFYTKDHYAAEDIVQEVFIKFLDANYEEQGTLRAFLSRMTINKSKDYLKSWAYKKIQLKEKWTSLKAKKKKDNVLIIDERTMIGEAILQLTLEYRELIILYYFQEMSIAEIAQTLEIPENTVKTRLRRARERLKPLLQDEEWEVLLSE